ncbi:hypothetical protein JHD46_08175 [Sulfurimonas sp. SAG-AH-194-C20]|nr:hypothetical protein [Sulfurimonas sp. SAG-AH-194-C20]MDF1879611.1 hypothetical protein [Sulfurimonas sp. SAG-AH-194-C20]
MDRLAQGQIDYAVRKFSTNRPESIVRMEAEAIVRKGIKDWNPSKGNISTFLSSRLQKLSRESYRASSPLSKPEKRMILGKRFKMFSEDFIDTRGKEPSSKDISRGLSISISEASMLKAEDFTVRTESAYGGSSTRAPLLSSSEIVKSLSERDKPFGENILQKKDSLTNSPLSSSFLKKRKTEVRKKIRRIELDNSLESIYV